MFGTLTADQYELAANAFHHKTASSHEEIHLEHDVHLVCAKDAFDFGVLAVIGHQPFRKTVGELERDCAGKA